MPPLGGSHSRRYRGKSGMAGLEFAFPIPDSIFLATRTFFLLGARQETDRYVRPKKALTRMILWLGFLYSLFEEFQTKPSADTFKN